MAVFYDHYIKPRKLEKLKKELLPTLGTVIYIDMVGSTILKDEEVKIWSKKMQNTFLFALKAFKPMNDAVVKLIGDEMFMYIPDYTTKQVNHIEILKVVKSIIGKFNKDIEHSFIGLKGAIHHCDDVYNILYYEGQNDYYGTGLELAEKLMSRASTDMLIISDKFYDMLKSYNKKMDERIDGTKAFRPKGINRLVKFYMLDCSI